MLRRLLIFGLTLDLACLPQNGGLSGIGSLPVPAVTTSIGFPPFPTNQGPLPQSTAIPSGTNYYFSGSGSGTTCTLAAPCTITECQTLARATLHPCIGRAGTITLAANLLFTSADNGEVWQNYPGESPIIDGSSNTYFVGLNGVNGWTFEGFKFQNMSDTSSNTAALDWSQTNANRAQNVTVRWNTFVSCPGNCMAGAGILTGLIDSNTVVGASNGNGAAGYGIGVYSAPDNVTVSHNLIKNTWGSGINMESGTGQTGGGNIIITLNKLTNTVTGNTDDAAIYKTDNTAAETGNVISYNEINLVGNGLISNTTKCIYLDDWTSNTLVQGNICRNGGQWDFELHGGRNNTFKNNLWDISQPGSYVGLYQYSSGLGDTGMSGNTFVGNTIYSSGAYSNSGILQLGTFQTAITAVLGGASTTTLTCSGGGCAPTTGYTFTIAGFTNSNCTVLNANWVVTNTGSTTWTIPASAASCSSTAGTPVMYDVVLQSSGNNYSSGTPGTQLTINSVGSYGSIVDSSPVFGDPGIQNAQSASTVAQGHVPFLTADGPVTASLGVTQGCTHGTNGTCGVATLSSGTVTVSTAAIAALAASGGAGYAVRLTLQSCSNCGSLSTGTVTAGTSFVINSTNVLDASKVFWEIIPIN